LIQKKIFMILEIPNTATCTRLMNFIILLRSGLGEWLSPNQRPLAVGRNSGCKIDERGHKKSHQGCLGSYGEEQRAGGI